MCLSITGALCASLARSELKQLETRVRLYIIEKYSGSEEVSNQKEGLGDSARVFRALRGCRRSWELEVLGANPQSIEELKGDEACL